MGLEYDDPTVQASVLEIVSALYDESMSEDEAVDKLTKLQCALTLSRATSEGDLQGILSPEPGSVQRAGRDVSTSPLRARRGGADHEAEHGAAEAESPT